MGRRRIRKTGERGTIPALALLSAAFLAGGLVGCVWAVTVQGSGGAALSDYVLRYLEAVEEGLLQLPGLPAVVWEVARWPLAAALLGLIAPGTVVLPILFAARGFLLSFAIASFVRLFGLPGGVLSFVLFGVTALVTVPTLFVLGVSGMGAAQAKRQGGSGGGCRPYLVRCGLCAPAVVLAVLLEYAAVPALVSAAAAGLLLR